MLFLCFLSGELGALDGVVVALNRSIGVSNDGGGGPPLCFLEVEVKKLYFDLQVLLEDLRVMVLLYHR